MDVMYTVSRSTGNGEWTYEDGSETPDSISIARIPNTGKLTFYRGECETHMATIDTDAVPAHFDRIRVNIWSPATQFFEGAEPTATSKVNVIR